MGTMVVGLVSPTGMQIHIEPIRKLLLAVLVLILTVSISVLLQAAQDDASSDDAAPPQGSVGGVGDVSLFPKRIVINGRRQITQIGLYNQALHDSIYEISLINMLMGSQGQLTAFNDDLDEDDKARVATASQFLRYSPRRVTLGSGESQLVRIMARAPADLPPGEYRSHFLVMAVPQQDEGLSIDDALNPGRAEGISVTIRPRFGISIPVIVRVGETTLDVQIHNPRLVQTNSGSRIIAMTLTRSGTRSAFGDILVRLDGTDEPIAIARGIGIYPEISELSISIPVNPSLPSEALSPGARLTVSYIDDDFISGNKLSELDFVVQ